MSAFTMCCAVVLVITSAASAAAGEFTPLAKYAEDANSVLVIDVQNALSTPLATREGWARKLETEFVDRTIMIPPEAERILVGSRVRPDRGFESDFSVAVFQLSRSYSLPAIARGNGGRVEQLRGKDVVTGVGDSIILPLDRALLGIFTPANRQLAGRWLSDSAGARSGLSPFLSAAVERAGKEKQIVFAIDLEDMVSADEAEKRLKATGVLKGSPYEAKEIAANLQSAKGLVVEVIIADDARASARLEFGQPVKASVAVMKRILQQVLQDNGMQLDELDRMDFNISGSSVSATTVMSKGGLRRLLSVVEVPSPTLEASETPAPDVATKTENSTDVRGAKSQAYFRSVTSLLTDLRGDRSKQDPRGGMDAVWMDKYAQKIDALPVLNVDEEIVDWGTKTAQTLRVMAGSRRGAGLSAGSQKSGLRTGVYFDSYYNVGVNSATATAKDANQIDVQSGNVATANRVEGWRLIDNATADIRKQGTQRYGIEF